MVFAALSSATGIPEPSLRLLISLLAAYPIAGIQRSLLKPNFGTSTRNLFNVASGLGVAYLFCQQDLVHSLFTVTVTYAVCWLASVTLGPKQRWLAAAACFIFNFAYLLIAYWRYASDEYDINWTTPQSVLTLRLIGFAFDFADGSKKVLAAKKVEKPRAASPGVDSGTDQPAMEVPNNKKNDDAAVSAPTRRLETEATRTPSCWAGDISLPQLPSFLEYLGYVYFSGSFLVGPQFSFSLYKRYITMELFRTHIPLATGVPTPITIPLPQLLSSSAWRTLRVFSLAVFYLAITQVLQMHWTSSVVLTPANLAAPWYSRYYTAWWAGKTALTKYLGVWILTEGACVLSGIAFDGITDHGNPRWTGLTNINAWNFEFATSLNQIIASFNTNTNHWSKLYLYKRLRFLNNKNLSAIGTLAFLSIWHGFHAGYAYAFSLEFVDMECERRVKRATAPLVAALSKTAVGRLAVNLACWFLTTSALYYAAMGFDLLSWSSIKIACGSLSWAGHIALVVILLWTSVFPGPRNPIPSGQKKTQ